MNKNLAHLTAVCVTPRRELEEVFSVVYEISESQVKESRRKRNGVRVETKHEENLRGMAIGRGKRAKGERERESKPVQVATSFGCRRCLFSLPPPLFIFTRRVHNATRAAGRTRAYYVIYA